MSQDSIVYACSVFLPIDIVLAHLISCHIQSWTLEETELKYDFFVSDILFQKQNPRSQVSLKSENEGLRNFHS